MNKPDSKLNYRDAGVNIDLAHTLLDRVKDGIRAARRPEMLTDIGGFGGLFQLDLSAYREPVLVSSIDGVGTKLMIAAMADRHDTVGIDIVHHCINDIAVQGAEPLYFMDYLGIGRLRSPLYEQMLAGLSTACREQNVALLGGETAEMPGMYGEDYDLAGCITGIVEKSKIITGEKIQERHRVIGLASNGLHTNGYSLARKVLFQVCGYRIDQEVARLGESVGDALLRPHRCYWPAIRRALAAGLPIAGIAHITGGGWYDNIARVLPKNVNAVLRQNVLSVPPIFSLIRDGGGVDEREMHRVFNMGVGMVWMVPEEAVDAAISHCAAVDVEAVDMGSIQPGIGEVQIIGLDS